MSTPLNTIRPGRAGVKPDDRPAHRRLADAVAAQHGGHAALGDVNVTPCSTWLSP